MTASGPPGDRITALIERLGHVGARLRKPLPETDTGPLEIDLWLPRSAAPAADELLLWAGFHRLVAPGNVPHRFYLACNDGIWTKIDAKLDPPGRRPWRPVQTLRRRAPSARRRLGPVIAFVGPDGAGKSTLVSRVAATIPVATEVSYLGAHRNRRSSPNGASGETPSRGAVHRRWLKNKLEPVFVSRTLLRHIRTLVGVYAGAWRGRIILCDRHPVEALAIDPRTTRTARTLERVVVGRLLPFPDRVVVLDAPAAVMFARKGEHDEARLDHWRSGYRTELVPRGATVVSTAGDLDVAQAACSDLVWEALGERRGWPST